MYALNHFDNGDFVTYSNINFGPSGTTKSMNLEYSKHGNRNDKLEIRLDSPTGTVIGTFSPQDTGSWEDYENVDIPLDLVDGVHDLVFVATGGHWIMTWKSFKLSEKIFFQISTDYKIDDQNGKDVQCTYNVVKDAYTEQVFNRYFVNTGSTAEAKFYAHIGANNEADAEQIVYDLCGSAQSAIDKIPLDDIVYDEQGSQFIKLYYAGRASWNEETQTNLYPGTPESPTNVLRQDASKVNEYKAISEGSIFKMPELQQFDPSVCQSHAAQCCWPRDRQAGDNNGNCNLEYDTNCVDRDVADNTDLCYNELDKAGYTNGIDANGFSTYDQEGPVHCHGFAWSTEDQETTTRYKANALFFVSMYDHMHQRGYVENIPGSPMCGCVEHMPIVTRADCTQTNVQEYYTFAEISDGPGFTATIGSIKLQFQSCQGANNRNNDLEAFVQQLVNDEKLSETEQNIFTERVVGRNNCPSAIDDFLEVQGFQSGHNIDDAKWTFVVGEEFDDQTKYILDDRLLKEMIEAQDVPIVRRVCPSCIESHRDIYYRRLTPMPAGFNLLETLMNNWSDTANRLNVDFSLHSTYLDAYLGSAGWTFCNFNDAGIGFPRDCGPTKQVHNQWNSYVRNGGDANHHAFMIPANPDFQTTIVYPTHTKFIANEYVLQEGTHTSFGKTTVSHFDNGDYLTYTSANFGSAGTTKGIRINYSKATNGGRMEVRLGVGTEGRLIGEFKPASTGSWSNYFTAYMDIDEDVEGINDITLVAKDSGWVLELAWFELADFSERSEEYSRIPASEYSDQSGVSFTKNTMSSVDEYIVGWFDNEDYVTYANVNFGAPGSTDGIRFSYSKASIGGSVEVRLDGPSGDLVGTLAPVYTGGWYNWVEGYIGLDVEVNGIHDLTFVGKDVGNVLNFEWFEPSDRSELFPTILANALSSQSGDVRTDMYALNHFDNGDFVTYSNINFGPSGTTKSMNLEYSVHGNNGMLEIRLDSPTGTVIGTFSPQNTGGWENYENVDIPLDLVDGVHDLVFVATGGNWIMTWKSFKLLG